MAISKVVFTKKPFKTSLKISEELLFNVTKTEGLDGDDFVNGLITQQINGWLWEHTSEVRTLEYFCPAPSFTDWLFRKKKGVRFKLEVKDLLLNPPALKDKTLRTYEVVQVNTDE